MRLFRAGLRRDRHPHRKLRAFPRAGGNEEVVARQRGEDVMHSLVEKSPTHKRVVRQDEAVLHAELEEVALADDLVADEIPRAAKHRLETQPGVVRVGDAIAPNPVVRAISG